ncbi:hypothetical protein I553_3542 [Mycobacterium xenopi 4042]|uniref:Uncharacterized protein n=1 Tax=Mycobacterium xenopi 4042 TaxID=1299334 RepID=X8ANB0_MYCXE|nr:hypothetical protein I553_3542 [Mycobacterium xenopi 4042]
MPLCGPARTGELPNGYQPTDKDLETFHARAFETERKIPGAFRPQRVNERQMHWLWERCHTRESTTTPTSTASTAPTQTPQLPAPSPPTPNRRDVRRHRGFRLDGEIDPRLSRAIKVSFTDSDIPASYQTFLVVDDFPTGLAWPGVADQIFALLNHFDGAGVDYTVHTRVRNRTDALAANTRALRQLSEQMDERSAEISYAQNFLVSRGQLLTAYNSHLEANPAETEIFFCPIIAVSAPATTN